MDMEEDQASGEPEQMDQSDEPSASSDKSNSDRKYQTDTSKQMIVKKKIEQYFHIITQGCGRMNCENPNCASNPENSKISGNDAAVKAIQLLQQKAEICPIHVGDSMMESSSASNHSASNSSAAPLSSDRDSVTNDCLDSCSRPDDVKNQEPHTSRIVDNEKKKDLKIYRVEGVKYLTEEMVDELILRCKKLEASQVDASDAHDDTFKQAPSKDPYNPLFLALTEVFSSMESLNRSFPSKEGKSQPSTDVEESMEIDTKDDNEATDNADPGPMAADTKPDRDALSTELSSFFSTEFPNTSNLRRTKRTLTRAEAAKLKVKVSSPDVDIESVRRVYDKLQGIERANDAFVSSLGLLSTSAVARLDVMRQLPGALGLNPFVIAMENPMLHSPEYFETALPEFCKAVGKLPLEACVVLVKWWSAYAADALRSFVECFQQLITVKVVEARLYQEDAESLDLHKNHTIANAVKCLKLLYYASLYGGKIEKETASYLSKSLANSFDFPADDFDIEKKAWKDPLSEALGVSETDVAEPILPLEEFQNEVLNESISVYNDFTNAGDYEMKSNEFTFMKYPFVLNIVNKTTFFFYDNKVQMLSGRRLVILQSILSHTTASPYLRLKIRRDRVIEDALLRLELIAGESPIDLRKQLYVEFEGEQGVDEGGVSKEFFQLVVEQIFNPDYGMFTYNEDTRLFWFNPHSFENSAQFTLIGIVLGLAIYNSCILDIRLPTVVFKKLLGKKPTLKDLKQSHPSIHHSLEGLLSYEGDVEDDFMAVFSVEYHDMFVDNRKHDLKQNGENIPVTNDNRTEFVDLYTSWLLNDSIKSQFEAFRHGFDLVVAKSPLKYLFRSDELEILITGSQEYDFKSLEEGTEYDGGFTKDSETVRHFWSVVHDMSDDDQKRLLQFTTGTDRAPVGGLAQLKLVIARNGPSSDRLPTAHTCFNVILLPDYKDEDKLKERLYKAITYAKGFGML